MNSILDSLTSPAPASPAPAATPTAPAPSSASKVIEVVASGDIPGVWIPSDVQPQEDPAVTLDGISQAGLGLYKPKQQGVAAVLFNPRYIAIEALQDADQNGQLTQVLPPISFVLGGGAPDASAAPSTLDGLVNAPSPTTGTPGEPIDHSAPLPILPPPTFSPGAQKNLAATRMKNIVGQSPSQRPLPGAGSVLNGLLQPVV